MDLGLTGRRAIVCASSAGLGRACATALAREGCHVIINGRDSQRLEEAAREIATSIGVNVTPVAADLDTDEGRRCLIAACPDADILVTNNAGPDPGQFIDWDRADWMRAIESNFFAPMFMIRALLPGMRTRGFGRIVNITSARVKSPTPTMGLSTSPRAALTALCKSVSLDVAADNVTINNLLPERFETDRQIFMAKRLMASENLSYADACRRIAETIAAKRMGRPEEFGDTCAFLCSTQAGYISGQNLQLDGGSYRGLI
jgi:3-oxoacyl-[acyl-carrier protein] reductase